MLAVEQINGDVVAKTLDMKIATVYSCRYQIQKMLIDEVALLESQANTHCIME